ncbi:MAG: hypothetical protein ACRETI_10100 [Steroidobacteraceae bacterium]
MRRLVLLALALNMAPAFAATTVENGYEVTRRQTVQQAPHGWVGRKTTDRETRVGNVPDETWGNSTEFVMTIGGWARKCPTAEGIVEGTFEYVITKDDVIVDGSGTRRTHYSHRLMATLKGQVGDDARLQYVEIEGEFTRQQDGTTTERRALPTSPPMRFTPGPVGEPDYEAMRRTVEVTGDLSIATAMLMAGIDYKNAELEWVKPNVCVEFSFDPPTDTRALGANQSADVRADIQTRGEQKALVSRWGRFAAGAINGIGSIAPRESESPTDSPHTIRYSASAQPKRGHGFEITALTRAGVAADSRWRIIENDEYELRLESTIISRDPLQAAQSSAHGSVRLTASTKPYKLKPDGKLYRLYDGTGDISFQTRSLRTDPCDPLIQGSGKSPLKVVDTWIVISPPQVQDSAQVPGKADIVLAYSLSTGGGETETSTAYENYVCVPGRVHPNWFWWGSFMLGREAEGDINFLKNWEYVGQGDVVARKVLTGSCGGECDEEKSVFTLRKVEMR